jgi:3-deoxy-manno-octulosonate cytidylyltransferase (CMP-KDO synthetase)
MINILCVIPSRIQSTRLERKALLPIQGKPMVQWTYENAKRSPLFSEVIVATDSEEIAALIQQIGGKVEMTEASIATGTERVAAVASRYPDAKVIVNLQGDEPFIKTGMLAALVSPYVLGEMPEMTTLASPLSSEHYHNPGAVKVVTDRQGNALYFSRSPLPFYRQATPAPVFHHMGLYAFSRDFLLHYATLPQTPLEQAESLEQLRVLEHGYKIRVCLTPDQSLEINTPEEYQQAQNFEYLD